MSRRTAEIGLMRMNIEIAQKKNGKHLRQKDKLACSCRQALPICPDAKASVPHAVRGFLSDLYKARFNTIRVIRVFRNAKPVSINFFLCELRDLCG